MPPPAPLSLSPLPSPLVGASWGCDLLAYPTQSQALAQAAAGIIPTRPT